MWRPKKPSATVSSSLSVRFYCHTSPYLRRCFIGQCSCFLCGPSREVKGDTKPLSSDCPLKPYCCFLMFTSEILRSVMWSKYGITAVWIFFRALLILYQHFYLFIFTSSSLSFSFLLSFTFTMASPSTILWDTMRRNGVCLFMKQLCKHVSAVDVTVM